MRTRFDRAPLHFAANFHKLEIIQWLLELGVDPNLQDSDGYKPLDLAFEFNEREPLPELVETLVETGTEMALSKIAWGEQSIQLWKWAKRVQSSCVVDPSSASFDKLKTDSPQNESTCNTHVYKKSKRRT